MIQCMFKCCAEDRTDNCTSGAAAKRQQLARVLRALGDPTRYRIFDLLMEGVQCNCEIAERLDLSLSLVSHHLRVLQRVGLVEGRRDPDDARWIYYSVSRTALDALRGDLRHLLDSRRIQPRSPHCAPKSAGPCR